MLTQLIDDFQTTIKSEQERITEYLTKEFKEKEFYMQETIDYLKMELQKRENSLYENIRIRELESKLKGFSSDALRSKALEESNKK